MSSNEEPLTKDKSQTKPSVYIAWCKRCGNCVAFCPTKALEEDEEGYPHLTRPEKCTGCRLCEMLCPDFAIRIGEEAPVPLARYGTEAPPPGTPGSPVSPHHSPERLAPEPANEDADDA
jgi:2-oxoglutarate ferredoxin oxidoreductase subunit delta